MRLHSGRDKGPYPGVPNDATMKGGPVGSPLFLLGEGGCGKGAMTAFVCDTNKSAELDVEPVRAM